MPFPYANEIEVVQAALHRVGEDTIASLDDGSTAAQIAASNYEGVVADLLTRHGWSFATKTVDLTLIGAATAAEWGYAFAVPNGVLNIRQIRCAGMRLRSGDWALEDGKVLVNSDADLQAKVTYRAPEQNWPADFAECAVEWVKAIFQQGLLDKWQEAQIVFKKLEGQPGMSGQINRAIVRDRRQFPAAKDDEGVPLARRWRGAIFPSGRPLTRCV